MGGRFPIVASLHPLTADDLVRIMTERRDAIVKQYRKEFKDHGTSLKVTPGACREIAQRAIDGGVGARGLKSKMEELLHTVKVGFPLGDEIDGVLLDRASVRTYYETDLEKRRGLGAFCVHGNKGALAAKYEEARATEDAEDKAAAEEELALQKEKTNGSSANTTTTTGDDEEPKRKRAIM